MTRREAAELLERLAIGSEEPYRSREVDRILADKGHAREVLRHVTVTPSYAGALALAVEALGLNDQRRLVP